MAQLCKENLNQKIVESAFGAEELGRFLLEREQLLNPGGAGGREGVEINPVPVFT